MARIVWEGHVHGVPPAKARAILHDCTGRVSFERSRQLDALGVPVWEPLGYPPAEYVELAAILMLGIEVEVPVDGNGHDRAGVYRAVRP